MNYMPINKEDAVDVAELDMELFDNCFNEHSLRVEIEHGWGFLALDDEGLAGYALVRDDEGMSDLTRLGVAKRCQGQGVGKTLLELVLARACDVMLCVRKDNDVAIGLYKKYGFEVVGELKDSWVMRKALQNKG